MSGRWREKLTDAKQRDLARTLPDGRQPGIAIISTTLGISRVTHYRTPREPRSAWLAPLDGRGPGKRQRADLGDGIPGTNAVSSKIPLRRSGVAANRSAMSRERLACVVRHSGSSLWRCCARCPPLPDRGGPRPTLGMR